MKFQAISRTRTPAPAAPTTRRRSVEPGGPRTAPAIMATARQRKGRKTNEEREKSRAPVEHEPGRGAGRAAAGDGARAPVAAEEPAPQDVGDGEGGGPPQ